VRPFLTIYRHSVIVWICVRFGHKSVYLKRFGQDYARSGIGRPFSKMPAGVEFSHLIYEAFDEVQAAQMALLDHVLTHLPRSAADTLVPIAYQRLVLSGAFPDGSPAVMSLVLPVEELNISDLEPSRTSNLGPLEQFEFPPEEAVFEKWLVDP